MSFLHGFRRITYEYQPLVNAIMCVFGLHQADDQRREPEDESRMCSTLIGLLERESQSEVFKDGINSALFKMAEWGKLDAVEILLHYGADLNFEDPVSYYNPLHIAILRNRPNIVTLLVRHGANIEKRDRIHESCPLDLASEESERLPCLLALLNFGANVNSKDRHGKTPLLHALASSDGVTVHNTDNIRLLLERGADVSAANEDGETVESLLVFLVKEALQATEDAAAQIGHFCLKTTRLLLTHGVNPSCCLNDCEHSLTLTSLEYFDLLFPLAVLLILSGVSLVCSNNNEPCWSAYSIIIQRLQAALQSCSDEAHAAELLEKAEELIDLVRVNTPTLHLSLRLEPPPPAHPYTRAMLDLHNRVLEREASPPALACLCRAFIRRHLGPWPLDERVNALPLPDRMKEYLLPEHKYTRRPGWDHFKPLPNQH